MGQSQVIVVGAGPAGLAVAAAAGERQLEVEVLEAGPSVATSWRRHYDRLHLHTTRRLSGLPGQGIPPASGRWVSRDDLIAYLEDYAVKQRLRIRFGTTVDRVDRQDGHWRLTASSGALTARSVVIATGYNRAPLMPNWPGRDTFMGELLHSSAYRNPTPYRGRDVLVVGAGNSGAEIAADLVEGGARKVWISIRTPPNIVRRNVGPLANQHLGIAVHRLPVGFVDRVGLLMQKLTIGDLRSFGLAPPRKGIYTRVLEEHIPLIDVGFLDHLKSGEIQVVPALDRFAGAEAWCGERSLRPDVVIAATGFSRGLEPLVGHLRVLGPSGRPNVHAPGVDPVAPGLFFIGYSNPIVGNLYEVSRVARKLAGAMAATLSGTAR
jgi:putative flavoprotein involved in K+ transport